MFEHYLIQQILMNDDTCRSSFAQTFDIYMLHSPLSKDQFKDVRQFVFQVVCSRYGM